MKSRLSRLVPGIVVSGGFTAWFVWTCDWPGIRDAMAGVRMPWVLLVAAMIFTEFIVRAIRWKALLAPLVPGVGLERLWSATVLGMSLNVFLPFRVGDIVRPWLVARDTRQSLLPFLTVAVIERVFDILGLTGVIVMMLVTVPHDDPLIADLRSAGLVFAAGAVLGLLGFMLMAAWEKQTLGLYTRLVGFLPDPLAAKFLSLFDGFARGLVAVRSPAAIAQAAFWSLFHWFMGSVAIYLLFNAFDLRLPFAAASLVNVVIALAVVLPQAPGYFGVFHTAIAAALQLWKLDAAPAQAFAITFWLVSFVPVSIAGAVLWFRERLVWDDLRGVVGWGPAAPRPAAASVSGSPPPRA